MVATDIRVMMLALMCAMLIAAPAGARDLFQWVDEDGVVNFSQWAPDDRSIEARSLHIVAKNPDDYDPANDAYSIANQAKRTAATWRTLRERRDERAEERRMAAEERRRLAEQYTYYRPYPYYARSVYRPWFPYYPHPVPYFKPHQPKHSGHRGPQHRRANTRPMPGPATVPQPRSSLGSRFVVPPSRSAHSTSRSAMSFRPAAQRSGH